MELPEEYKDKGTGVSRNLSNQDIIGMKKSAGSMDDTNRKHTCMEQEGYQDYIVGIGASAGGLEALQQLLSALPSNTGFPYIIIQHLSPDYKSLLGEILGKYTEMPVIQVEHGIEINPNTVYVIQPGKNMRLEKGRLLLSAQKERELNLPIDVFFRSLASESGSKAIAIVLSGTGSDGTNGIKAIKEHDGMIIVQDLESSKFDGMPRSAIRTGLVDAQLNPSQIATELQHISVSTNKETPPLKEEKNVDEELMKKIYLILKKICNINFAHYKQTTILRRIERRMMLVRKETLNEYVNYLYEAPDEVRTLSKEVLIGVTNFFRDPEYFQILQDKVIHEIVQRSTEDDAIRVWVAGCSTGEEAYSIAILFCEVMDALKIKRIIKIFATDLDVEAIAHAGKGVYGDSIIDSVSPARLSRYFSRKNNTYIVNRDIRKMIVFSPHNVFQDPPFGHLDLISCRNMLIYFQPVLQNDLFGVFHTSLKDAGYLFLGKSEAIGAYTDAFPVLDAAAKIFTHRNDVKIPGQKTIPFLQSTYIDDEFYIDNTGKENLRGNKDTVPIGDQATINAALLECFMPACLVINEKNDILHFYGDSSNYVHLPRGRFTNCIFELITEALKIPVSNLLKEARDKKQLRQYKDITFQGELKTEVITLTAMPVNHTIENNQDQLYALVFIQKDQRGEMQEAVTYDIDRMASQRITDLEQELSHVQGKLDCSIAEQECVNEELQAANEELLTANEELQSSNEELQSVNEELYTVNSEYQQKLTELADLNDDIANFLSSTMTGIIFVDNKLNIRRYTDYVTTEFSVMAHDIGRSLKFISYHFPSIDITEICENVLKSLVPDEREVITSRNKIFFMRIAPYRSTENKILGCVITLIDVTTQKQGQVQLASAEKDLTIAREAAEAKSDYLSRVSHEIRTPMGTLINLCRLIKQKVDDSSELAGDITQMSDTIEYMASIVTDMSEVSRLERESFDDICEPFSLLEMLDQVSALVENNAKDAGLAFEVSYKENFNPMYIGNKTSLLQILINFINNSIKYTPAGGAISVKVYEDKDTLVANDKVSLCFKISDTGIGIKKEFLSKLFEPFTREVSEEQSGIPGLGLGLSIARNLIYSMNGDVTVESEIGKGSTFTVHVLLSKAKKKSSFGQTDDMDFNTITLQGCKMIVAEDNSLNRSILCSILLKEGVQYVEAEDGEEALHIYMNAPDNTFDCILMDMRMPKLDGIKATILIRGSGKTDAMTIPIIGVSANGFSDDIKRAKLAGITGYTTKPIDRDNLLKAMKKVIKEKKSRIIKKNI